MRHRLVLLPVLLATLVCAPPALAWTWPQDGPVLQPFVLGGDPYAAGQHRGIDVAGPAGAPVRAPTAGTVSFAGTVPSGGRTVTIQTADGFAVTLLHLGSLGVVRGATVAEGASVGTLTSGGDADHAVPYVQMGVRIAADPQGYLDPLLFLPARVQTDASGASGEEPAAEPVEAAPADPPVSVPTAGAASSEPPVAIAGVDSPAAPSGTAVAAEPDQGAVVEVPARTAETTSGAERAEDGSGTARAVTAPEVAISDGVPRSSTEPAADVKAGAPVVRLPDAPSVEPSTADSVAARADAHEPGGFPAGLVAAALAMAALVTASLGFGWLRWRFAEAPVRIPPRFARRVAGDADPTPEPTESPQRALGGPGGPNRRLVRSGPHADSPVAALLRRARRARGEALRGR